MQKNMFILQKKESYSKRMLYESQLKWTNFSYDVVRKCKELIMALEQAGITQYQLFENQQVRYLDNIKQRIHKFDLFLKNNSKELNAKGYGTAVSQKEGNGHSMQLHGKPDYYQGPVDQQNQPLGAGGQRQKEQLQVNRQMSDQKAQGPQ